MIICLVTLVIAIALLITAGLQLEYINSQRKKMNLIINEPLENAPPSLAFATVAMGAFRGLVVDALWIRADRLKEEGQFFDARQLAEWIVTLQPRFTAVWEFHAWNMAYNISVAMPATQPDQRWRWVKNGYELIRDRGIPQNPRDMGLYHQIAWIFQHKIGAVTDDAHEYYKLQLAMAMEPLLGPADEDYFKALAEAPKDLQEIIKNPGIAEFVAAVKFADSEFADDKRFVSNYLALIQNPRRFKPEAFKVRDAFRGTETLRKFDVFAKACQLRNTWKLDPVIMQRLNQTYGPIDWNDPNRHLPLDWRHPDTHAIYWAVRGLEVAKREEISFQELNTDRIVNHSLQNLYRNGKIYIYDVPFEPSPESLSQTSQRQFSKAIFLRPDLRMFEPYNKLVTTVIEKYKGGSRGAYESMRSGHRNMLRNAALSFYQAGHADQALKIYNQLRKLYPLDEFKVDFITFIRNRLREELSSLDIANAKEIVEMTLRESYFRFAMHDDDMAANLEKMAQQIHTNYQAMYKDEQRIDLPAFSMLKYLALVDFLYDRQYPLSLRRGLFNRIRLEKPELSEQLRKQEEEFLKQTEQAEERK